MTDTAQTKTAGTPAETESAKPVDTESSPARDQHSRPKEIGGRKGPDPTRYGDWEKNGRCIDF